MAMSSELRGKIESIIASDKVVLFMKGTRQRPQCGFSAQVVEILDALAPSYTTVDVLSDPGIREGIKEYASWPTIPQLYIEKEFVGGCDIIMEMYESNELQKMLSA
jgi:monothiol glutaredoxin